VSKHYRTGRRALVIGAGHNGLVAANLLADRGWDVRVFESTQRPGGAIRSDRTLHPDFVTDWFSAFYPLSAASPVIGSLQLERWGLTWRHAPAVLAHVLPDGRCAVLSRDPATTAASLAEFAPGDGDAWLRIVEDYERIREPFLNSILRPFPPVRPALSLARRLGVAETLRFARFAVQAVRRFGDEHFSGEGGPLLFAGNALHTDLAPESAGSAIYGWLLCMLGQSVGFPVPEGGSGAIVEALVTRLHDHGGRLALDTPVESICVEGGRATGVRLGSGELIAADAVLADVGAPQLYLDLVGEQHLPPQLVEDLDRFQWDSPTMKVNWALSRPIPWIPAGARGAGTVHLGVDMAGLTFYAACLAARRMPDEPFVLLGQMTTADPTRSPAGTESAWAYTHVPEGLDLSAEEVDVHAARIESLIERHAPGFRASIVARAVQAPADLQGADANLVGGAVGGGTSGLHQQLVFRPVPGLARAETPIDGLYLAGASAHPGGGVHGGPGSNAAAAALRRVGPAGRLQRAAIASAYRRIYR
jgi:phytoene dehydrogenase-like protein